MRRAQIIIEADITCPGNVGLIIGIPASRHIDQGKTAIQYPPFRIFKIGSQILCINKGGEGMS